MNPDTWAAIGEAVGLVRSGRVTRVDGPGWIVYAVGAIIRIDLKEAADFS